ncbi:hypothetical protein [Okeania sp.]|nr:hypothetical protein [Okeania sp.]MEB3339187.1 hypothetical protein [Okeania sp.]
MSSSILNGRLSNSFSVKVRRSLFGFIEAIAILNYFRDILELLGNNLG